MAVITKAPPATGRRHERAGSLTGTWTLVRFILRRDRIRLPVWILAIPLSTVWTASTLARTYPTAADRQARAGLLDSPAGIAFSGPGYGLDDYTYGAMMANEMLAYLAIAAGLMGILLFVRHTRAEEEAGRAELVRAGVVGQRAQITAALIVVGGACVAVGLLTGLVLGGSGIESLTWSGSLLFGAAVASVGLVFTGVAALTAQVTEYGRGAAGMAGAALGVAYVVRAAGDIGDGTLSWLSPFGWAQYTKVYVGDRWWPLLPALAATAVLVALAFAVTARRDVGAGLMPSRPGPRTAEGFVGTAPGSALRLQRPALFWWTVSMAALGATYGAFANEINEAMQGNETLEEWVAQLPGGALSDRFLGVIMLMMATVAGIYVVMALQRLRGEETGGRAEPLLATPLSRARWVACHLGVVLLGSVLVLLVSGLCAGITGALVLDDSGVVLRLAGASLAYAPALWVVAGAMIALFGLAPRFIGITWAVVVYAVVVSTFGGILQLPMWMNNLSPFGHVPQLPGEEMSWTPLLVLTALAALLIAAGLAGFRRRDLTLH